MRARVQLHKRVRVKLLHMRKLDRLDFAAESKAKKREKCRNSVLSIEKKKNVPLSCFRLIYSLICRYLLSIPTFQVQFQAPGVQQSKEPIPGANFLVGEDNQHIC